MPHTIPHPDQTLREEPRKLTDDELGDIRRSLPNINFLNDEIYQTVVDGIWKNTILPQLKIVKVVPSEISREISDESGFNRIVTPFKDQIIEQFVRSKNDPGKPIGAVTADAVGEPITQTTLKVSHFAGRGKARVGIDSLQELMSVSQHRKNSTAYVILRNKDLMFRDAMNILSDHSRVTLHEIIRSYDFLDPEEAKQEDWYNSFWAIKPWEQLMVKSVFRLQLDQTSLIRYRVTPKMIGDILEAPTSPPSVVVVPSPIAEGIIDIYIMDDARQHLQANIGKLEIGEDPIYLFSHHILVPFFKTLLIRPGGVFREGVPVTIPVMSLVLHEEHLIENKTTFRIMGDVGTPFPNPDADYWRLIINPIPHREKGIPIYRLGHLLFYFGFILTGIEYRRGLRDEDEMTHAISFDNETRGFIEFDFSDPEDELYVESVIVIAPKEINEIAKIDERTPVKYLLSKISEDKKRVINEENSRLKSVASSPNEYKPILGEASDVERLSEYWIIETEQNVSDLVPGMEQSNLSLPDLLSIDFVDPRFSVSNHLREIAKTLGLEALRAYIFQEFYQTLSMAGDYVDPQHIALISDYITHPGFPIPMTGYGYSKRSIDVLSNASYDRAPEKFMVAAATGRLDSTTQSGAAAIAVGGRVPVGTGLIRSDLIQMHQLRDVRRKTTDPNSLINDLRQISDRPPDEISVRPTVQIIVKDVESAEEQARKIVDRARKLRALRPSVPTSRGTLDIGTHTQPTDEPLRSMIIAPEVVIPQAIDRIRQLTGGVLKIKSLEQ